MILKYFIKKKGVNFGYSIHEMKLLEYDKSIYPEDIYPKYQL